MATTYYNDIQKLYVAYFNRPADPKGLAFWESAVEAAGGSTAAVSAAFAGSDEYKAAYANQTNAQIVDTVYQNLFGRPAEDAGKAYWAGLLDKGTVTIDAVVTAVAAGAQGSDMTAYNNKVTAAAAFTAAVDTDAEKAGYSGNDANKVAKTFLSSVTDNASLQAATTPATLNASVAATVAAGTPFTVASALAQVSAAQAALDAFVKATATTDVNGDNVKDANDITATLTNAVSKVAADLGGGSAGDLFTTTTSQTVRDALVAAQQATNSANLSNAQTTVTADNTAISKVAGLSAALSTLTGAQAALKSAQTAEVAAHADITAKEAAFGINNGGTYVDDGATMTFTPNGGSAVTLATITNGKATLADGVDATKYTGLTDMISSFNTETAALSNVTKADANVSNAQLAANLLDVAPDTAGTVGGTGMTESALIKAIADQINATTANTVASGATPTLAQIQTELAVLKATDVNTYTSFKALVDAETGADASFNPLVAKLATDTTAVTNANNAISGLAKDLAALQSAQANANTLAGDQATVTAYTKVLTDKGYVVTALDAAHTTNFATSASDVYTFDAKTAPAALSIAAFGLQGSDAISVGSGYTLVKGAIGDTGVTSNDANLEIFVSSNSTGDAVLQIEAHAYSSSVATTPGEVVTITLTGVDATTLHLNNGIITTA